MNTREVSKWNSVEKAPDKMAYRGDSLFTVREEGGFYIYYGSDGREAHKHSKSMGIEAEGFHQIQKGSDIFPTNPIYAERIGNLLQNGAPEWVPLPRDGSHPALVAAIYLRWGHTSLPTDPRDVHPAAFLPS